MERITYERRRVYDPLLRLLHAWLALCIAFLIATAWLAELFEHGPAESTIWHLHAYAGFGLTGGLLVRLVWGIVGPGSARLTDLWQPRAWLALLRRRGEAALTRFGHHPLASAAYLALYLVLIGMSVTGLGLAAIEHDLGPLAPSLYDSVWLEEIFEEPHEAGMLAVLGFIVLHLGALVWHERRDGVPVAQAMVTGYQYRRADVASNQEDPHAK